MKVNRLQFPILIKLIILPQLHTILKLTNNNLIFIYTLNRYYYVCLYVLNCYPQNCRLNIRHLQYPYIIRLYFMVGDGSVNQDTID